MSWFVNTFAGATLDRASERRLDADWLAARSEDGMAVLFWQAKPLLTDDGAGLARLPVRLAAELAGADGLMFLGLQDEQALFAAEASPAEEPSVAAYGRFEGLREAALGAMQPGEAGVAAVGKALLEWHGRSRFCSVCGQRSEPAEAGWKRICLSCRAEHFPRTDPVVIMLPVRGDHCLVGRAASWAPGRFSALAGFVEPGESIEEACAREVQEEAGLRVTAVRHHSSQPWPFPTNLMIGLIAEVAEGEARADQTELEAVRWLSRAEARDMLAGRHPEVASPPPLAIAHQLIRSWAEA